ncbi:2-oxoglutarate dehydrogenase complex dihydrolipoyllysine-residue succinyltransferase [Lignipirellula cremea]|uniref:Dihydrolipoyllysine-residue succinyltransferase component of 2-oxoglutarate dehydrogenase complex n=1 Tax=Lignipirellula cremea TaxID=2528010 RepID=A0A518DW69_9BACT|nr:2-oxoglutarate dehydrogenase complex dihydrolipoyllysine-residue succinyltransferase [Lignipirellula cremea]QDU96073.1 Dihydrolipoyllysine-residue succinyltransferase component of 2-oxoglutarate dehydrogenase complex [Lignipirellula cremea]
MTIELNIPQVGESIQEVQIGQWLKQEGDYVEQDETIVELETDKASVELPAPQSGVLTKILKKKGQMVSIGETVGHIDPNGKPTAGNSGKAEKSKPAGNSSSASDKGQTNRSQPAESRDLNSDDPAVSPAVRRLLREHHLTADEVKATGEHGRLLKEDVQRHVEQHQASSENNGALEEIVPMSLIRRRIAERLVSAQQQAALLTTFNEIDMTAVMALRSQFQENFLKRYNIKLGFMSFFIKAAVDALKQFPAVNAEVRGTDIVYRNYYHVGVAIGGGRGLVVPVLRHAERMSFAEIEQAIADFGQRAAANKITPDELDGGTFTISNGGIYGSLLSTPIVNPPQSGVLGMHAIVERPVALNGQVVIRPMMYVALTYDHRLVDGREAVTFLKRIREAIEDPARMLIEV